MCRECLLCARLKGHNEGSRYLPSRKSLAALGLCKHRGYAVPMSALPLIAVGLRQATASLEASVSSFAKWLRIQWDKICKLFQLYLPHRRCLGSVSCQCSLMFFLILLHVMERFKRRLLELPWTSSQRYGSNFLSLLTNQEPTYRKPINGHLHETGTLYPHWHALSPCLTHSMYSGKKLEGEVSCKTWLRGLRAPPGSRVRTNKETR